MGLVNSLILLTLGVPLERLQGTARVALAFYLGIIGGTCCYLVANNHSRVVGMSGGCYALIGMKAVELVLRCKEKSARKQLAFLLFIIVADSVQAVFLLTSETSHSAHFGGCVAGFIASVTFARRGGQEVRRNRCLEKLVQTMALLVGVGLAWFCVSWGMAWPPRNIFDQVPWCWARQVISWDIFGDGEPHCVRCDNVRCIEKWSVQPHMRQISPSQCASIGGWAVTER